MVSLGIGLWVGWSDAEQTEDEYGSETARGLAVDLWENRPSNRRGFGCDYKEWFGWW